MSQYSISIFGNIQKNRTEAEISFRPNSRTSEIFVGIIFENENGWVVERENKQIPLPEAEVQKAKVILSEYVNRKGIDVSQELSVAGHSLLLMLKTDGTAMGQKLTNEKKGQANNTNSQAILTPEFRLSE